jgi:hypothetical protein
LTFVQSSHKTQNVASISAKPSEKAWKQVPQPLGLHLRALRCKHLPVDQVDVGKPSAEIPQQIAQSVSVPVRQSMINPKTSPPSNQNASLQQARTLCVREQAAQAGPS